MRTIDEPTRPNVLTVVCIAFVACAGADLVHEVLGHAVASWLVGDRILALSSVALQNAEPNRFVSACGTLANVVVGAISLLSLRRRAAFRTGACFLWLFGTFNLCNTGYLVYSAVSGSGDWAAVVSGWAPAWAWRSLLAVAGTATYVLGLRATARAIDAFVEGGELALRAMGQLIVPAYLAAGALFTLAAVFNPIGPSLVLVSGIGASFGLNAGMLVLPRMLAHSTGAVPSTSRPLPFSLAWVGLGLVVALGYVAVLGPGIQFAP